MSEFVRSIDKRFYDQPGFSDLQYAWEQVFEVRGGASVLDEEQALQTVRNAHLNAQCEFGYSNEQLYQLESIACKYARESTASHNFEMEEL